MNEVSKEVAVIDAEKLSLEHNVDTETVSNITTGLNVYIEERAGLIEEYNKISDLEVTKENLSIFRNLRLGFQKNRTKGTNDWHKKAKEIPLRMGQLIDAIKRNQNQINESYEDALMQKEKYFEIIEEKRIKALQKQREELIAPYIEDVAGRDLAGMEDDVWEAYLTTSKQKYENRIEAMRKAEEERIEANRRECLNRERLDILRPYFFLLADTEYEYLGSMEESAFSELLESAKKKKVDYDAEQKRIREENERLQKEKEAAEKKAAEERAKVEAEKKAAEEKARKEREAIEAKAKKEREAAEKKLAAERAEKARIEKELQDKKDAEEAAAKAKADAEKKAARAPDKDKIASFIEFLCLVQYPTVKSKEAQQIVAYAQNKVKELVSTLKQQNDRM